MWLLAGNAFAFVDSLAAWYADSLIDPGGLGMREPMAEAIGDSADGSAGDAGTVLKHSDVNV